MKFVWFFMWLFQKIQAYNYENEKNNQYNIQNDVNHNYLIFNLSEYICM